MRRDIRVIDDAYLDFVRRQLCIALTTGVYRCGGAIEPHHLVARGWREAKRNDYTAIPMCRYHHVELEQIGPSKFEAKYAVDVWREAAFLLMEWISNLSES